MFLLLTITTGILHLVSPRLIIRPYERGDESQVLQFMLDQKERLKPVLDDWVYAIANSDDAAMFIRKMKVGWRLGNLLTFSIWCKQDEKLIGQLTLFNISWPKGELEMGYYIHRSYERRGLMIEAVDCCIQSLKNMGVKRVRIECSSSNTGSCKVAQRSGFLLEGNENNVFQYIREL